MNTIFFHCERVITLILYLFVAQTSVIAVLSHNPNPVKVVARRPLSHRESDLGSRSLRPYRDGPAPNHEYQPTLCYEYSKKDLRSNELFFNPSIPLQSTLCPQSSKEPTPNPQCLLVDPHAAQHHRSTLKPQTTTTSWRVKLKKLL